MPMHMYMYTVHVCISLPWLIIDYENDMCMYDGRNRSYDPAASARRVSCTTTARVLYESGNSGLKSGCWRPISTHAYVLEYFMFDV